MSATDDELLRVYEQLDKEIDNVAKATEALNLQKQAFDNEIERLMQLCRQSEVRLEEAELQNSTLHVENTQVRAECELARVEDRRRIKQLEAELARALKKISLLEGPKSL